MKIFGIKEGGRKATSSITLKGFLQVKEFQDDFCGFGIKVSSLSRSRIGLLYNVSKEFSIF